MKRVPHVAQVEYPLQVGLEQVWDPQYCCPQLAHRDIGAVLEWIDAMQTWLPQCVWPHVAQVWAWTFGQL